MNACVIEVMFKCACHQKWERRVLQNPLYRTALLISMIIDHIDLSSIDPFFRQPYQRQTLSTSADEGRLLESLRGLP